MTAPLQFANAASQDHVAAFGKREGGVVVVDLLKETQGPNDLELAYAAYALPWSNAILLNSLALSQAGKSQCCQLLQSGRKWAALSLSLSLCSGLQLCTDWCGRAARLGKGICVMDAPSRGRYAVRGCARGLFFGRWGIVCHEIWIRALSGAARRRAAHQMMLIPSCSSRNPQLLQYTR
eukprot:6174137-Pleurochrysis_carterae.AAC.2